MRRILALAASLVVAALARADDDAGLPPPALDVPTARLVFVSAGYPAESEPRFRDDARVLIDRIEKDPLAEPLRLARRFEHQLAFAPSPDDGILPVNGTVPDADLIAAEDAARRLAPAADVLVLVVRTRASVEYFRSRSEYGGGSALRRLVNAPGSDLVVLRDLLHLDLRGAIGALKSVGRLTMVWNQDPDAIVHELGHTLFGLDDEYVDASCTIPPALLGAALLGSPNLSVDARDARLRAITGRDALVEGGYYVEQGVFRGEDDCRMRSRGVPYCKVCRAVMLGDPSTRPGEPVIVARARGDRAHASWTAAPGPAPDGFVVELRRDDGTLLRTEDVAATSQALGPLDRGDYRVGVRARRGARTSMFSWSTFSIGSGPDPSLPVTDGASSARSSEGITSALENASPP